MYQPSSTFQQTNYDYANQDLYEKYEMGMNSAVQLKQEGSIQTEYFDRTQQYSNIGNLNKHMNIGEKDTGSSLAAHQSIQLNGLSQTNRI